MGETIDGPLSGLMPPTYDLSSILEDNCYKNPEIEEIKPVSLASRLSTLLHLPFHLGRYEVALKNGERYVGKILDLQCYVGRCGDDLSFIEESVKDARTILNKGINRRANKHRWENMILVEEYLHVCTSCGEVNLNASYFVVLHEK